MDIVELEEYKRLKELKKLLTEEILLLVEEREDIVHKKSKYLESLYLSYFGYLSKTKFKLEIKTRRIRRKIALMQSYINRNEKINMEKIEAKLDQEMLFFNERLKKYEQKIELSKEFINSKVLTPEEIKEVKKIFRKIAKKLHPDLNPHNKEQDKMLWNLSLKAYDNNDIDSLKRILFIIDTDMEVSDKSTMKEIQEEVEKLQERIKEIYDYLKNIKKQFPFNLEEKLEDDDWIKKEKDKMLEEINDLKIIYEKYEKVYEEIKGENSYE